VSTKLRADTLAQIAADILVYGLPAPMTVNMFTHGTVQLRMEDDEPVAVDLWAKHLGLPEPTDMDVQGGGFVSHNVRRNIGGGDASKMLPGWSCVEVWAAVHLEVRS
jgi:hypothetical protein